MELQIRPATRHDLPAIVELLADDPLGQTRESPSDPAPYRAAFEAIDADPHQLLVVAEFAAGAGDDGGDGAGRTVAATMQLTFIPGLSRRGAWRAQVEGVRVAAAARGHGLGERLIRWAVDQARARGAALVQLTSDNSRPGAHRFYQRLGFVASHTGFKLDLRSEPAAAGTQ